MGPHNAMATVEVVLLLEEVHAAPKALCGTINTPQQLCHDLLYLSSEVAVSTGSLEGNITDHAAQRRSRRHLGHLSREGMWREAAHRAAPAYEGGVVPVALDGGVMECDGCLNACKHDKPDMIFQEMKVMS